MEFLKPLMTLGTVIGIAMGIQIFSRHCRSRFGYSFFTARGFWLAAIGINLLWWGYVAWGKAALHHESMQDGIILMAMGLAAVAWLGYENVRHEPTVWRWRDNPPACAVFPGCTIRHPSSCDHRGVSALRDL